MFLRLQTSEEFTNLQTTPVYPLVFTYPRTPGK